MSLEISNSLSSTSSSESEEAIIIIVDDDDKKEVTVQVDENSNNLDLASSNPVNLTNDDLASPTSIIDVEDVDVADDIISKTGNVDDGNSISDSQDHNKSLNDAVLSQTFKRRNNYPYDSSQWERLEGVDFCAYRVLPNDMSLNGRVFAISVLLKIFDCRFNCGDIVELQDGTKVVFLGIRCEKETVAESNNSAAAVEFFYFYKLVNSNIGEYHELQLFVITN